MSEVLLRAVPLALAVVVFAAVLVAGGPIWGSVGFATSVGALTYVEMELKP